jgi:hypothetical protein
LILRTLFGVEPVSEHVASGAVVAGRMYMVTRRCSKRRFFMRPDDKTNNAFIYCLGLAAKKYGVKIIFTAAMSNHHHTGVLDDKGNRWCAPALGALPPLDFGQRDVGSDDVAHYAPICFARRHADAGG